MAELEGHQEWAKERLAWSTLILDFSFVGWTGVCGIGLKVNMLAAVCGEKRPRHRVWAFFIAPTP